MGVDTALKLRGNVSPEAIKNALEKIGCINVDISDVTADDYGKYSGQVYAYYNQEKTFVILDGLITFTRNHTRWALFYLWNSINTLENLNYYQRHGVEDMVRSETTYLSMTKDENSVAFMMELIKELGGGWLDENDCDNKPYAWVTPSDAEARLEALGNPPNPEESDLKPMVFVEVQSGVSAEEIKKAEQVLIDNGIEADEAATVLQAVGYALLGKELYKS